ncbi:hypothetical protein [Clostridium sp.]|jgi:hypothetical protein|uniref:hypothetical protein n=1 Tax=Clostridium sp. TaxID=1506 RepID=UPI0039F51506
MKKFEDLINETLEAEDSEELEAAADLFQFGIEKGYYTKTQAARFNDTYWKVKDRCLAAEIAKQVKGNKLDIISIVSSASADVKNDNDKLISYVNDRLKALRGKIKGLK